MGVLINKRLERGAQRRRDDLHMNIIILYPTYPTGVYNCFYYQMLTNLLQCYFIDLQFD